MRQKITLTLKNVDIQFEMSVDPLVEVNEALAITRAVFPGAIVERVGEPIPGRLESIAIEASDEVMQAKAKVESLGHYKLTSKPYYGQPICKLDIDDLREWRAIDEATLSLMDIEAIDLYLGAVKEMKEIQV